MPEKISKEDALQLENFALKLEAIEAQREAFMSGMRERYHLGDQDRIDMRTLTIMRAPVPAPEAAPPAEPPAA